MQETPIQFLGQEAPLEKVGYPLQYSWAFLVAQMVKNPPAMWETWVWSLDWEDHLEEGMVTTGICLTGELPWTEEQEPETGGLQSIGSQRVEHGWTAKHMHSDFTSFHLQQWDNNNYSFTLLFWRMLTNSY